MLLLLTATGKTGKVLIDYDDITLVEELRPLRLVSNRSVTAIAEEDILDGGSGTTKLLDDEQPLETANE